MNKTQQEQLRQLLTATHDGNLISKTDRDYLVTCGYAQRRNGWNIATPWGVEVAANLKLTATNTEALPKRTHPPIKVSAEGVFFGSNCFLSHDRMLQGLPDGVIRKQYNEWVNTALKMSL